MTRAGLVDAWTRQGAHVRCTLGRTVDASAAERVMDGYWAAVGVGRATPALVDVRHVSGIGADARAVLYRRAGEFRPVRGALVGRGGLQRFVFEFLLLAARLPDVRYFTSEAHALAWLREGPG